jgi:hypothetical protein
MIHANNDTFKTRSDDDGLLPMEFVLDEYTRPLKSVLSSRQARLESAEEEEVELLSRIQDAESMRRHVPAFLERKLARVRERVELLRVQILSLEDQLEEAS